MAKTSTAPALLHVALQDIHAGKAAQADRLPAIASKCSDPALVALVRAEAERAHAQAERIRGAGVDIEGPENLWMTGILDDAERDTRATEHGRLLDVALIGALRKGKAAEIVSSETAIALAREIGDDALLAVASANHAEENESDRLLKARLDALTGASA
jgi:ferritin-like metal-binding protein YciE